MGGAVRARLSSPNGPQTFFGAYVATFLLVVSCLLCSCTGRTSEPDRDLVHFPRAESLRYSGDYDAAIESYLKSIGHTPGDPRSYFWLVECYYRKGDLEPADRELRSLLAADPHNPCVRYGLGCLAVKRKQPDEALREAEAALSLDRRFGHGYLLMGTAHYYTGRPREALGAWDKARRIFHAHGDMEYEAWAINRVALVRRELAEYRKALEGFRTALDLQRSRRDEQAQQLILGNVGLTQADMGDLDEAMEAFHKALSLARSSGDRQGECWNLTNLSFLHDLAGDHRQGLDYADSTISLARAIRNPVDEVGGLLYRAAAATALGDPLPALADAKRALVLSDSLADLRSRAGATLTMARASLSLGQYESAREEYARADSLFRDVGAEQGSWEASMGLCETVLRLGDTAQAASVAERTLARCSESGYADGEEALNLLLSDLNLRRGKAAEALARSTRALDLSRRDKRRSREALALCRRAGARLARGDRLGATEDADLACRLARDARNPEILWECEWAAAEVERASDPEEAVRHYRAAIDAVESTRRKLRLEEFKAALLERRIDLHYRSADLLVQLGRHAEAMATCERARGSALREFLLAGQPAASPLADAHSMMEMRSLEGKLGTLEASLSGIASGPDPDRSRMRALEREIARTKVEWARIRQEILLSDPAYGVVPQQGTAPDVENLAGALAPDEALIEYAVGNEGSLCFVVRRGGIRAVRLNARARTMEAWVRELRRPLLTPRSLGTLSFDAGLARRLREQLVDPIEPHIEGARLLFIVPDGALNYLPFETLVFSRDEPIPSDTLYADFRRTTFLCDRYAIRYLPSAAFLSLPRRIRSAAADFPTGSLLAVGGSEIEEEVSAETGDATTRDLYQRPPRRTAELPFAAQEARMISALFPGSKCLVGGEATEASLKRLAPAYRFLHLSSHGVTDEAVPIYSGIRLAADPGGADDGFLHAYEILGIPLRCELVTLSACESGLGRVYAGEGILGLTRSLLYAGADQVVVSLWSVNDESTALLMERFYTGVSRGLDMAEALREAKRDLRTATRATGDVPLSYAHPFFWAPFVLIGPPPVSAR